MAVAYMSFLFLVHSVYACKENADDGCNARTSQGDNNEVLSMVPTSQDSNNEALSMIQQLAARITTNPKYTKDEKSAFLVESQKAEAHAHFAAKVTMKAQNREEDDALFSVWKAQQVEAERFMARQCPSWQSYPGNPEKAGERFNQPEDWDHCPCSIKGLSNEAESTLPDICDPALPLLNSTRDLTESTVMHGGAMAHEMYNYIANVVESKAPRPFLVFSSGNDSPLWAHANQGGETIFLEDSQAWIDTVKQKYGNLDIRLTEYNNLGDRNALLRLVDSNFASATAKLDMPMIKPCDHFQTILVDGPSGVFTGRMQPIFMANRCVCSALLSKTVTFVDVFVHDADRQTERTWADQLLGRQEHHGYRMIMWPLKDEHFPNDGGQGPLRHYRFDSTEQVPYCKP